MLITIISYFLVSIAPLSVYIGYNLYRNQTVPNTLPSTTKFKEFPASGMSVVNFVVPIESEEEYLTRLKFLHSEAWDFYNKSSHTKELMIDQDRHVNMLMLKFKNEQNKITCDQHTMKFEDGTEIWIGNKYYSYGNVYSSPLNRPRFTFSSSQGRLSPYTFMCVVDLDMELQEFSSWKRLHDNYDLQILKRMEIK